MFDGIPVVTPKGVLVFLLCTVGPAGIAYWQLAEKVIPDEPRIIQFRLDPAAVLPGERAKLVWEVVNAERVVIQPDLGSVSVADSRQIQVLTNRTFTLTATKGKSVKVQALAVTPAEPPTPVVHFAADPPSQLRGERTTLTWNVTDADSVVISGIGKVPASGSREEVVSESRTYELRATNRFNKSAVVQVGVSARDWSAPTLSVSADPNPVVKGRSTTVRWQSGFAKQVVIEPFGPVELSGSKTLEVGQSVTIRARAEGPGGSQTVDLIVEARQLVAVSIPKNQDVWIRLVRPLGSGISHAEEAFEAVLQRDLRIGNMKIAGEGAKVWGRIARIEAPGRVRGRASIELTLERLALLDGSIVQIETNNERKDKSSLGKDMFRALVAAGAGAAVGASIDGRTGAAQGAAGGTAAGVAVDLAERGEDVLLPAGTEMKFKIKKTVVAEMLRIP